ncbi:MAG: hypothetical protein C5B51_29300 [Terriglobia bacterium]|nr:MAG: hypothetical protein C5B51_29300 [Terriglobia bacterium]
MGCIFISYRRHDSSGFAGRIYDHLVTCFGKDRVFMDVSGIAPGEDFTRVISARLSSCSACLAIIGERWVDELTRPSGGEDFVRIEIGSAIQGKVRVIPVLVGGASMPRGEQLPDELRPLATLNAMPITHESFDDGMARLIEVLEPGKHKEDVAHDTMGWRLPLICLFVALLATLVTRYFFASSSLTADAPLSAAETLFVFLIFLTVIGSAVWLFARRRRHRISE